MSDESTDGDIGNMSPEISPPPPPSSHFELSKMSRKKLNFEVSQMLGSHTKKKMNPRIKCQKRGLKRLPVRATIPKLKAELKQRHQLSPPSLLSAKVHVHPRKSTIQIPQTYVGTLKPQLLIFTRSRSQKELDKLLVTPPPTSIRQCLIL